MVANVGSLLLGVSVKALMFKVFHNFSIILNIFADPSCPRIASHKSGARRASSKSFRRTQGGLPGRSPTPTMALDPIPEGNDLCFLQEISNPTSSTRWGRPRPENVPKQPSAEISRARTPRPPEGRLSASSASKPPYLRLVKHSKCSLWVRTRKWSRTGLRIGLRG